MNNDIIVLVIELVVLIGSFVFGRFIIPRISQDSIITTTEKVNLVIKFAESFVSYAKQAMQDKTGEEKMQEVVKLLAEAARKHNIDISDDEIKAIAQKAYDTMKQADKK